MISLLILVWLMGGPLVVMLFIVLICKAGPYCDRMAQRALDRALPPARAQVYGGPLDGLELDLD